MSQVISTSYFTCNEINSNTKNGSNKKPQHIKTEKCFQNALSLYTEHLKTGYFSTLLNAQKSPSLALKTQPEEINKLVQYKNIRELLVHIWGESDISYKISFLKNVLILWPHPLLYLEYSHCLQKQTLLEKNQKNFEQFCVESQVAKLLGIGLSLADASCYHDKSIGIIVGSVCADYLNRPSIIDQTIGSNQNLFNKTLLLLKKQQKHLLSNLDKLSDPSWISGKSLKHFFGQTPLPFLKEKCLEIRKNFIENELVQ